MHQTIWLRRPRRRVRRRRLAVSTSPHASVPCYPTIRLQAPRPPVSPTVALKLPRRSRPASCAAPTCGLSATARTAWRGWTSVVRLETAPSPSGCWCVGVVFTAGGSREHDNARSCAIPCIAPHPGDQRGRRHPRLCLPSWHAAAAARSRSPQGFERLVPVSCLSNNDCVGEEGEWEKSGRQEVELLARSEAAHLPTRRQVSVPPRLLGLCLQVLLQVLGWLRRQEAALCATTPGCSIPGTQPARNLPTPSRSPSRRSPPPAAG